MFRIFIHILLACSFSFLAGCAQITEVTKKIWGSSTAALERARADALSRTYTCSFTECYEAVLGFGRTEAEEEAKAKQEEEAKLAAEGSDQSAPGLALGQEVKPVSDDKFFTVFLKDPRQKHIVVIGVAGNVNTTEVGIFFEESVPSAIKIDVSSLSTTAKHRVAQAIFAALDKHFAAVGQL